MDASLDSMQQAVLDAYRERKGRSWKRDLGLSWETGRYVGATSDEVAVLQGLRNNLGPEWLSKYQAPKKAASDKEQREFAEQLVKETGLSTQGAHALSSTLGELAAKHLKLSEMSLNPGLDDVQSQGRDGVESKILEAVTDMPGITHVVFMSDPRGTTVGIKFDSGASNSLVDGGVYKVPVAPSVYKALEGQDFWSAHAAEEEAKVWAKEERKSKAFDQTLKARVQEVRGWTDDQAGQAAVRDATYFAQQETHTPERYFAAMDMVGTFAESEVYRAKVRSDFPAVAEAVEQIASEAYVSANLGNARSGDAGQKELMERLIEAGAVEPEMTARRLIEAATAHTKLAEFQALGGLSDQQEKAKAWLRADVRQTIADVAGIKDVEFGNDPRDATVILALENSRSNRMSGGWTVPIDPAWYEKLGTDAEWWTLFEQRVSSGSGVAEQTAASGGLILAIENTANAAFVDVGHAAEIARIISEAADKIEGLDDLHEVDLKLRDLNGNGVGSVRFAESVAELGVLESGTVRATLSLDRDATPDGPEVEAARILRRLAQQVKDGALASELRDINGNVVGGFAWRPEAPELDADDRVDLLGDQPELA